MANQNDKRIMELRALIDEKKKKIGKKERFSPITKCQIEIDGTRHNIHTFDRKQSIALLVKLNAFLTSAKELGFENEYEISGYSVQDWMEDLKEKIRIMDKEIEEKKLDVLEKQLNNLLSEGKKVELELDAITEMLK